MVELDALRGLDFEHFTAVVLPECSVPSNAAKALREFAADGGIVLAFGRSAFSLASSDASSVSTKPRAKAESPPQKKWIEEREAARRKSQQPGSVFRIELAGEVS